MNKYTKNIKLEEYDFIHKEELEKDDITDKNYINTLYLSEKHKNIQNDMYFKYEKDKLSNTENITTDEYNKINYLLVKRLKNHF